MREKTKILIISSYKILCGIATFTEALESLLSDDFDVSVAPLDPDILKRGRREEGDAEIRRLLAEARNHAAVNIQLEWGLLGSSPRDIARRFKMLLAGPSKIILTFHTPLMPAEPLKFLEILHMLKRFRFTDLFLAIGRYLSASRFNRECIAALKEAQRRLGDNLRVVTHTRRESKFFKTRCGLKNVHDHPLSLLHKNWPAALKTDAVSYRAFLDESYGQAAPKVGFFGFISSYKGLDVLLKAALLLPEHVFLIFGSVHPEAIRRGQPLDDYLGRTLELMYWPDGKPEGGAKPRAKTRPPVVKNVFFMGSPNDYDFAKAIAAVDVCVFPYLEVGQSASGPAALAIELGKTTYLSNNRAFQELARYFPDSFAMFDIGNHIQLAQYIKKPPLPALGEPRYDCRTLREFYAGIIDSMTQSGARG